MWAQKLSSLPPAAPPAPSHASSQIFIKSSPGTRRGWAGLLTAHSSPAVWETHTYAHVHAHNTHSFADFLFLLTEEEVIESKPTNFFSFKKKKKGEKWAEAPKPARSPISEFSQSLGLACVRLCVLGVGMCLFSISLHAFSSWAPALPLLPSCCKPPFAFKAFRHNELIFPCSLWKPGYVRETCSLGGPF